MIANAKTYYYLLPSEPMFSSLRASASVVRFINREALRIAEEGCIPVTLLTNMRFCKVRSLAAARVELMSRMRANIRWQDEIGLHRVRRVYRLASEVETQLGWTIISTVDIARLLNGNHSSIVLGLRRAKREHRAFETREAPKCDHCGGPACDCCCDWQQERAQAAHGNG